MAIKETKIKVYDGSKNGNNFRFMPWRKQNAGTGPVDTTKVVFRSLPYVRVVTGSDLKDIATGTVTGPTQNLDTPVGKQPKRVTKDINAPVVPLLKVANLADTVDVRNWENPEDKDKPEDQRRSKQYVDWATFKEMAPGDVRLVKYVGDTNHRHVNVEIWTGLFMPFDEKMFQLELKHGSVSYQGARAVSKAAKAIIDPNDPEPTQKKAQNLAKVMVEDHGQDLGGMPQWSVRTWQIEYSSRDSAMVLAYDAGAYYTIRVEHDVVIFTQYTGADAKKWEKRFTDRLIKDLHEVATRIAIEKTLESQASAA